MFEQVQALADDPILKLSQLYREDTRSPKLDVGVGVFQDAQGLTPIMRAVKNAEKALWEQEKSKSYVGLMGNLSFNRAMQDLILGADFDATRVRGIQATAGTGALRLIAEVMKSLLPGKRFHVSNPTWGNHLPIFAAAGFKAQFYPYYDAERGVVNREAFFEALQSFNQDDIVLLHGCCHNPSGADLSPADWDKVAEIAVQRGFLPIIDLAYLGFGEGLTADAYGVRKLASSVENLWIAASCSKNFGLYRDRAGEVLIVAKNAAQASALQSHFGAASRAIVSMPPDHGASIVAQILNDEALRQDWEKELNEMSAYIRQRRAELSASLKQHAGVNWDFIVDSHRGMFTLLPLGKERVQRLREEYAIYIVGEGRINLAGLKSENDVHYLAQSIAKIL